MILVVICFFVTLIYKTYESKKETEKNIQNLPKSCFETTNGEQVCLDEFDSTLYTIIIFFHPECEHCQYEAKEIGSNYLAFENANVIFITPDDSIQRVENFASDYHIWDLDNIELLLDKNNLFFNVFGSSYLPSLFIYRHNKLVISYKSEIKIEVLLNLVKPEV